MQVDGQRVTNKAVVQLISKPIVEPFRDGSKCLVRDLCLHLSTVQPHVMGTREATPLIDEVAVRHEVYSQAGSYAPALKQNLQALSWLLRSPKVALWHSIFAPNPRASQAFSWLKKLKKIPTLQTIASPPRHFERPERLLYGDIVVAQSAWTKRMFHHAFDDAGLSAPPLFEIPPPAPEMAQPSAERLARVRGEIGIDEHTPLFVYPGDLEVSHGVSRFLSFAEASRESLPQAKWVVAYRNKTEKAAAIAAQLAAQVDPQRVIFQCNVPDIAALLAASRAVLFPVDDLYGKVDLPIVLLEAMSLGVPVLAENTGPLASLHGAVLLGSEEKPWLDVLQPLVDDPQVRAQCGERALLAIEQYFAPQKIARAYEELYQQLLQKPKS